MLITLTSVGDPTTWTWGAWTAEGKAGSGGGARLRPDSLWLPFLTDESSSEESDDVPELVQDGPLLREEVAVGTRTHPPSAGAISTCIV